MKTYEHMWNYITQEISHMSYDKYHKELGEIRLLSSIIIKAAQDRDLNYFKSEAFQDHCYWLRICHVFVASLIIKAWKYEESGKYWNLIPDDDEEVE